MIVSSAFYVLSIVGSYLLFRLRFKEVLSLTGSIILANFSIIIVWVSKGMLDIPGLCLSIWAVYLMILSFKKDSRFIYLASPLVIIGFFTRYTVALIIPVLLIQFLLVDKPLKYIKTNCKHIIIGTFIGILTLSVFLALYHHYNLPMFFLSQTQTISSSTTSTASVPVENNLFYYINNLLAYVSGTSFIPYSLKPIYFSFETLSWPSSQPSPVSYILIILMIIGWALYLMKIFTKKNIENIKKNKDNIKLIIILLTSIIFLITYTKTSIFISIGIISITLLTLYRYLNKTRDDLDFVFIMFYWFIVNFIFFTYHQTKVDRYSITFTPFLAFSIILGLELLFDKFHQLNKIRNVLPIVLICAVLICNAGYCLINEPHSFDNQAYPNFLNASNDEKIVGEWLTSYDKNYSDEKIWADRGGDMSFLLKMNIPSLEEESDDINFTKRLTDENITYFITKDNKTINTPYVKLYQHGEVSIYGKK